MARLKTKFTNYDDVAHLWAHAKQWEADGPNGRMYFRRNTIYSYGTHFPIASLYYKKDKSPQYDTDGRLSNVPEVDFVMFTTRGYSNTTTKHIYTVRRAMPNWWKEFNVPNPTVGQYRTPKEAGYHKANLEWYVSEVRSLSSKAFRSRKYKDSLQAELLQHMKNGAEYIEFFKCGKLLTKAEKELFKIDVVNYDTILAKLEEGAKQEQARDKAKQKRLKAAELEDIEQWKAGEHSRGYIGNLLYKHKIEGHLLRAIKVAAALAGRTKKVIETSNGNTIDFDEGKALFEKLFAMKVKGKEYDMYNVKRPLRVNDSWHVKEFTKEGDLTVGCTLIKWSEIERFAISQKWMKAEKPKK